MRPRLFAAEIKSRRRWARLGQASRGRGYSPRKSIALADEFRAICLASMRPRLFAAEIQVYAVVFSSSLRASMRPRLFAAEIHSGGRFASPRRPASMRPRLFAAEIKARADTTGTL